MAGKDKARYFLLFVILNFAAYFTIQYLTATHQYDFLVEFDRMVPLMPQFIWIYHSIIPISFITMIFVIDRRELFFTAFWSCVLAAVILCICYILFPSFYPRPEIEVSGVSSYLLKVTHMFDRPNNTFPSGHVTFTWLMFWAARESKMAKQIDFFGSLYLLWAIGVSMSTLVLKQHYLVDVISGIVLSFCSFYCVKGLLKNRLAGKLQDVEYQK